MFIIFTREVGDTGPALDDGHLKVGPDVRGGVDAQELGAFPVHHLNEDRNPAIGHMTCHRNSAQRLLKCI